VKDSPRPEQRHEQTAKKIECCQGWKQDESKARTGMMSHIVKVKEWIKDNKNLDCSVAFEEEAKMEMPTPKAIHFVLPPPQQQTPKQAL